MQEETIRKAAQELGKRGGKKGGKARLTTMTAAERSASARHAVQARWAQRAGAVPVAGGVAPAIADMVTMDFDGHEVAYILDDEGQPWWLAKHVCAILGHDASNTAHIIERLDDDERSKRTTTTVGFGLQKAWFVNEPGLYSLIVWSEKHEAKQFKRWITHEVLPAIRRAGKYQVRSTDLIKGFLSPTFLPWEKRFEEEFLSRFAVCLGRNRPRDRSIHPWWRGLRRVMCMIFCHLRYERR